MKRDDVGLFVDSAVFSNHRKKKGPSETSAVFSTKKKLRCHLKPFRWHL